MLDSQTCYGDLCSLHRCELGLVISKILVPGVVLGGGSVCAVQNVVGIVATIILDDLRISRGSIHLPKMETHRDFPKSLVVGGIDVSAFCTPDAFETLQGSAHAHQRVVALRDTLTYTVRMPRAVLPSKTLEITFSEMH